MTGPEFLSCDWGTSFFRLRRVRSDNGKVVAELREPFGVRSFTQKYGANPTEERTAAYADFFRQKIVELYKNDLPPGKIVAVISGMASSSLGWRELPYAPLPFCLDGSSARVVTIDLKISDSRNVRARLISGACSDRDIMRGEETEIIGLLHDGKYQAVSKNGIIILPGTHSKHVRVQNNLVVDFRTFMTGELFDALSNHTVLRATLITMNIGPETSLHDVRSRTAFLEGVCAANESGLAPNLFQVRTRSVLKNVSPELNRSFLSGLLIGAEISALKKCGWNGPILLAAGAAVRAHYQLALESLVVDRQVMIVPEENMERVTVRAHQLLAKQFCP